MRKSLLKTIVATAVVGVAMALTSVSTLAAAVLLTDGSYSVTAAQVGDTAKTSDASNHKCYSVNNITFDLRSNASESNGMQINSTSSNYIEFEVDQNVIFTFNEFGASHTVNLSAVDGGSIYVAPSSSVYDSSATVTPSGLKNGTFHFYLTAGKYKMENGSGGNAKIGTLTFATPSNISTLSDFDKYEWDFSEAGSNTYSNGKDNYVNYQGGNTIKRGIVKSNYATSNISLYIDSKPASTNGKFTYTINGDSYYIQMNKGTYVYIPVYEEGDIVKVTALGTNGVLSDGDNKVTTLANVPVFYVANATDVSNGYVLLTAPSSTNNLTNITLYTKNAPFSSSNVKYYYAGEKCYAVSVISASDAANASRLEQAYGKKFASTDTVYKKVSINGVEYDATYAAFGGNEGDYLYATIINKPGSSAQTNVEKITTNLFN